MTNYNLVLYYLNFVIPTHTMIHFLHILFIDSNNICIICRVFKDIPKYGLKITTNFENIQPLSNKKAKYLINNNVKK